ncbi:MAG: GNAT family N-acetyltransferase [Actinomycetota bacterium]
MQPEIRVRRPRPDEAGAVADLLNAHSVADIGVPDTTNEEVAASWDRPGREPEDVMVAEQAGEMVGYLEVDAEPPWTGIRIDGYVRLDRAGRGIGTALLEIGERRARMLALRAPPGARVAAFNGAWHESPASMFLQGHGYTWARAFWRMAITMAERPPAPALPDGVAIRAVVPGRDEGPLHAAVDEAFGDHWEHRPVAFDRWLYQHRTHPGFDPGLWLMAVDGDEVAGGLICHRLTTEDPDCGWIDEVAVRRPWRRRGVALALLHHAFGALYARGIRKAALTVDSTSPTGAGSLYERAGMQVQRRIDVYSKVLVPGNEETNGDGRPVTPKG